MLAFALFVVCAMLALSASAAFAESEWLVEGAPLTAELAAESEGELELVKYASEKSATVLTVLLCSGIFVGTIGPGKKDKITALLSLDKTITVGELEMPGEEASLNCTVTVHGGALTDCELNSTALLWVDNLNAALGDWWNTEIELMTDGRFLDDFSSNLAGLFPGYEVECKSLAGLAGTELCEGLVFTTLSNDTTTTPVSVRGTFEGAEAEAEKGTCTLTGKESADVKGSGHTWAVEGGVRLATGVS